MNFEIKSFPYKWSSAPVPLRMNEVRTLVLHHMDHPTWTLKDVHEEHLKKGWKGAGYNYWIDFDGTITEVRGLNYGAHASTSNGTSLGIGFRGAYHSINQTMPDAQFNAGVWLIRKLSEEHSIKRIKGHFEVGTTDCPGRHFPLAEMKGLRYRGFIEPKYYQIAQTHVVEVDPLSLKVIMADKPMGEVSAYNLVNGGYFWFYGHGQTYPLGIVVSEGKVISNRQPHYKPAGTLIVYKDGTVAIKELLSITGESDVWFAISGCSIHPKINMVSAGFTGIFSDIGKPRNRPIIGYSPEKKKIILAVRPSSNIARAQLTAKNLGCSAAITLDAGDSTNFRIKGKDLFRTSRRINHFITW